jgi:hypothetical protein
MRLTEATPEEPHETARHVHCRAIPLLQQPAGWLCHLVLLSRQALRYRQSRWANRPCYHRCLRRQHGQRCAMLPRHANAIPMHAMPRNAGRTLCWLCIHIEAIVGAAGGAGSCCTACSYCMAGVSSQRQAARQAAACPHNHASCVACSAPSFSQQASASIAGWLGGLWASGGLALRCRRCLRRQHGQRCAMLRPAAPTPFLCMRCLGMLAGCFAGFAYI